MYNMAMQVCLSGQFQAVEAGQLRPLSHADVDLSWLQIQAKAPTVAGAEVTKSFCREVGLVSVAVHGELFDRPGLAAVAKVSPSASNAALVAGVYRERGERGWPLLNGSFAAVVVDEARHAAFVVNDRFGSIPLFYMEGGGVVAFSTSADWVAQQAPEGAVNVDVASVACFLTYQRLFGDATYYEEVRALPPGSCLRMDGDGVHLEPYFTPRYQPEQRTLEEWAEALADAWRHAVIERTADNPVMLMSGGLDSRAVLAARPELPSVIFADFENHEVAVARQVAELTGSRLDVLIRPKDFYERGLDAGVRAGGGMYPAHMAHVCGFEAELAARGPAVIHGNPPEAYFRNSSLYSDGLPTVPEGQSQTGHLLTLFRDHGKYRLDRDLSRLLVCGDVAERFDGCEDAIRAQYDEAAMACTTLPDLYTWIDTRYMSRYPSYVFELALAQTMPKRTPMWDNALYDLHLAMPWEIRTGDALWTAMIRRLNPKLAELPSANVRSITMHTLPVWVQNGILRGLGVARRLGVLPRSMPSDPTFTLGSWPNFDELLRHREGLRQRVSAILDDNAALPEGLIDRRAAQDLWRRHLNGEVNRAAHIFALLTFGLWHKQSTFGSNG